MFEAQGKTVMVSVRLSGDLYARIEKEAEREQRKFAAMMRILIAEAIRSRQQAEEEIEDAEIP